MSGRARWTEQVLRSSLLGGLDLELAGDGSIRPVTTELTIRTEQRSLWLCFEPWANEYTVPPHTAVVIHFPSAPLELTHHPDGIIFISFGRHPDIWSHDGQPLEIFSDVMPETPPGVAEDAVGFIIDAVPPIRTHTPWPRETGD
jgi:hypothetical protein